MREYRDRTHRPNSDVTAGSTDGSGVLAELVDEAVLRLDADGILIDVNSRFEILADTAAADLVGSHLASVVADGDRLAATLRALRSCDHGEQTTLGVSLRTDGEGTVPCQLSLAVVSESPGAQSATDGQPLTRIVGTVRPVDTADAELRRRADQQAAVATLGQSAIETDDLDALLSEAARLVGDTLDCAYCKVLDLDTDREELRLRQGVGWRDGVVGTATVEAAATSQAGYTLATDEPVIIADLDEETRFTGPELLTSHDVTSGISVPIGSAAEPWGVLGAHDTRHRQFTDDDANFVQSVANVLASAIGRHARTQELRQYERIVETVNDGVYMVDPAGRFTMVNEAYCELTGYDREQLVGAETSIVADESVRASASELEAEMATGAVEAPTMEATLRTADGGSVDAEATFALLPTGDRWERIGIVRDISERKAYQRRLETERTKLAALDEVNSVVREITNAVLDQSRRHEIEQLVCESLAASEAYRFAWIGEVDSRTREVVPHAEAGTEGYLEAVTISTDPADPLSRGPAGQAVVNQELQVTQNVFADPEFEPWRDVAREWGYQSVAAIPIAHDGTLYGVLGLYSEAADAFTEPKLAIIGQLGEIVGHAIAAVERKQALMSDTVTELEFEIRDVFADFDLPATDDERLAFDRTIPVGDGDFLIYGRATDGMVPAAEALTAQHPTWESFTPLERRETETTFELRLSEPPVTSLAAEMGGSVERATVEDGHLRVAVHLPQAASVRQLLARIRERYPTAHTVARRQITRSVPSVRQATDAWATALTDRQRASLEAAFFAGFFEWPRHSSGEEIADSMTVSPATFHQHLRAAERKLFGVLFEET